MAFREKADESEPCCLRSGGSAGAFMPQKKALLELVLHWYEPLPLQMPRLQDYKIVFYL
jgi:hypothetical protein